MVKISISDPSQFLTGGFLGLPGHRATLYFTAALLVLCSHVTEFCLISCRHLYLPLGLAHNLLCMLSSFVSWPDREELVESSKDLKDYKVTRWEEIECLNDYDSELLQWLSLNYDESVGKRTLRWTFSDFRVGSYSSKLFLINTLCGQLHI